MLSTHLFVQRARRLGMDWLQGTILTATAIFSHFIKDQCKFAQTVCCSRPLSSAIFHFYTTVSYKILSSVARHTIHSKHTSLKLGRTLQIHGSGVRKLKSCPTWQWALLGLQEILVLSVAVSTCSADTCILCGSQHNLIVFYVTFTSAFIQDVIPSKQLFFLLQWAQLTLLHGGLALCYATESLCLSCKVLAVKHFVAWLLLSLFVMHHSLALLSQLQGKNHSKCPVKAI